MPDTVRSISSLQTLLADNTSGAISAQDLRDMLVSVLHASGSMTWTVPAASTISTPGTPVKAAGTTTAVNLSTGRFSMPESNRLLYNGPADVHAHIACSVSVSCASNNQDIRLVLAKNGELLTHSIVDNKISTAGDEQSTALHADTMLTDGDYLELWIGNNTSTGAPTINHGYLFALGMPML